MTFLPPPSSAAIIPVFQSPLFPLRASRWQVTVQWMGPLAGSRMLVKEAGSGGGRGMESVQSQGSIPLLSSPQPRFNGVERAPSLPLLYEHQNYGQRGRSGALFSVPLCLTGAGMPGVSRHKVLYNTHSHTYRERGLHTGLLPLVKHIVAARREF